MTGRDGYMSGRVRSADRRRAILLLSIAFLISAILGCEEEVTAILDTDRVFEIYGVLNPAADTQYVRVFPITSRLEQSTTSRVDARVTTTDLESGEITEWNHSLLVHADGTTGHLFRAAFRPVGGRTYRLNVARSDGRVSRAIVVVPRLPEFLDPVIASDVSLPVLFGSPEIGIRKVEVEYYVEHGWCAGETEWFTFDLTDHVYMNAARQRVDVPLSEHPRAMMNSLLWRGRYNWTVGVVPQHFVLRLTVGDAAWSPPGGLFDPDVLIEPGVFDNVADGFGFVGAGYHLEIVMFTMFERPDDWRALVSLDVLEAAGFTIDVPDPPMQSHICVPFG